MLTFKQFQQLCKESTLNSIYLADYKNTLNIHPSTVQSFFDSYIDSLMNDYIKNTLIQTGYNVTNISTHY